MLRLTRATIDCSKIARALPNFTPKWTARKGAAQLYEAYRDRDISLEEIEGYLYRRLGQITRRLSAGDLDGMLHRRAAPSLLQGFTRSNGSACEDISVRKLSSTFRSNNRFRAASRRPWSPRSVLSW
jgi:hypothetical protein